MLNVRALKRKRGGNPKQAQTETTRCTAGVAPGSSVPTGPLEKASMLAEGMAEMSKYLNTSLSSSTVTEYKVITKCTIN